MSKDYAELLTDKQKAMWASVCVPPEERYWLDTDTMKLIEIDYSVTDPSGAPVPPIDCVMVEVRGVRVPDSWSKPIGNKPTEEVTNADC